MLKTRREPCQLRNPGISAKTDTTNGTGRSSSDPRHFSLGEPDADTDLFHDGFRKHEGLAIALAKEHIEDHPRLEPEDLRIIKSQCLFYDEIPRLLTECMLDLGPPEQLNVDALPGEPAAFSLDLPMEFRARIMGMDWIPPVDVRVDLGISEADAAKHPQRWESEAVNWPL
ncbi:MAG: hypothetical protein OXE50_15925 [Chloroflexi bacterium]|nr:hypothetical protein [Chloroflexota bacterium]